MWYQVVQELLLFWADIYWRSASWGWWIPNFRSHSNSGDTSVGNMLSIVKGSHDHSKCKISAGILIDNSEKTWWYKKYALHPGERWNCCDPCTKRDPRYILLKLRLRMPNWLHMKIWFTRWQPRRSTDERWVERWWSCEILYGSWYLT